MDNSPKKKLLIRKINTTVTVNDSELDNNKNDNNTSNNKVIPITPIFLTPTSWIHQGMLSADAMFSDQEFQELWDSHPPGLGKIKLYGKVIDTPRYQQTYLRNYTFTGMDHQVDTNLPLPP